MKSLTGNKIAAAVLSTALVFFGLKELSKVVYTPHKPKDYAYAVDIPDVGGAVQNEEQKGPVDFGLLLASASAEEGAKVAKKCASCHSFEKGGPVLTGPDLWGILGRASASYPGFKYSKVMQEYGKAWDYQNLYDFLANPRKYMKGTAMSFAGLKKQKDRIALLAYLRQQSDTPPPLPQPLAPAESAPQQDTQGVEPPAVDSSESTPEGNGQAEKTGGEQEKPLEKGREGPEDGTVSGDKNPD